MNIDQPWSPRGAPSRDVKRTLSETFSAAVFDIPVWIEGQLSGWKLALLQ